MNEVLVVKWNKRLSGAWPENEPRTLSRFSKQAFRKRSRGMPTPSVGHLPDRQELAAFASGGVLRLGSGSPCAQVARDDFLLRQIGGFVRRRAPPILVSGPELLDPRTGTRQMFSDDSLDRETSTHEIIEDGTVVTVCVTQQASRGRIGYRFEVVVRQTSQGGRQGEDATRYCFESPFQDSGDYPSDLETVCGRRWLVWIHGRKPEVVYVWEMSGVSGVVHFDMTKTEEMHMCMVTSMRVRSDSEDELVVLRVDCGRPRSFAQTYALPNGSLLRSVDLSDEMNFAPPMLLGSGEAALVLRHPDLIVVIDTVTGCMLGAPQQTCASPLLQVLFEPLVEDWPDTLVQCLSEASLLLPTGDLSDYRLLYGCGDIVYARESLYRATIITALDAYSGLVVVRFTVSDAADVIGWAAT